MENNDNQKKLDVLIAHAIGTNDRLEYIDRNLEKHMQRSEQLETRQDFIEEQFIPLLEEHKELINTKVKPMLQHFEGLKWAISALTVVTALVKILDFFKPHI